MKLDSKRTILIGFAFLSISAFWQMYDNIIPLILKYFFEIGDALSGFIMALDNIFALIMLPVFGALSDKVTTNRGKRTPFILVGTVLAVIFMMVLPIAANMRNLALFVVMLLLTLMAMGVYRSPAVSLMPDVTPKPLRSKGNALINLMGAVGVIAVLGLTMVLSGEKGDNTMAKVKEEQSSQQTKQVLAFSTRLRHDLKKACRQLDEGEGQEDVTISKEVKAWLNK